MVKREKRLISSPPPLLFFSLPIFRFRFFCWEFNILQQKGFVVEHQDKFNELESMMLTRNKGLAEEYFILSFFSGLKDEIRAMVQMFNPTSLTGVMSLAKLQEPNLASQLLTNALTLFQDQPLLFCSPTLYPHTIFPSKPQRVVLRVDQMSCTVLLCLISINCSSLGKNRKKVKRWNRKEVRIMALSSR